MHEVLVNRLGGLGLPRKSVVRLTDRPDMTLDVYRGRKTTTTIFHFIANANNAQLEQHCMILMFSKIWNFCFQYWNGDVR